MDMRSIEIRADTLQQVGGVECGDTMVVFVAWWTLDGLAEMGTSWPEYVVQWNQFRLRDFINHLHGNIWPRVCMVCGRRFSAFQLHHGIVTRRDVQGWKLCIPGVSPHNARLALITNVINCIPLHPTCHQNPPTRQEVWDYAVSKWGQEIVSDWYNSLPWKIRTPPRYFD